jgi:bifunctional non-homologous end joining protein LigD
MPRAPEKSKKKTAKKTAKTATKKAAPKKAKSTKKPAARKTTTKKAEAKKTPTKKAPAKKSAAKKRATPQKALTTYRHKRDFGRTPEPSGAQADGSHAGEPSFVIQRHRARALHYDFRLEIDGVLVSWAVPKGVTLDPKARHLAVHVEDHPLDYADFEGVIPAGEYGGGDVIVWDRGTWELHGADDARAAVEAGEIHVELHGEKLAGRVVLVRTGDAQASREQWLVLHKKDDAAVADWNPEDYPKSVISGLDNDEIAARRARVWTRHGEEPGAPPVPTFDAPTADELAALDALGAKGTWTLQGRELALTNLDKVLFPARGKGERAVTKRELVRYFACIAPTMLPYLAQRPLNLHRYPDGVEKQGFWQKQAPAHAPEWIPRWHREDADEGESELYFVADSPPALAWLANHAAVELHAWTSHIPEVERPDYALIDIDPGTNTTWDELLTLARLHRTALEHIGVRGYPKTSGKRGLQVWIPIVPGPSFSETRDWVDKLSRSIAQVAGDLVSAVWEKRERGGRARLDYTQNAINKTLVAPYSVRAAAGAPVSMPISWDELDDPELRSDRWTIRTALDRLAEVGDLMAPMLTDAQQLPELG